MYEGYRGVSLAQTLVNLQRFERRRLCDFPILKIECISFCQANIGERVVWIFVKSSPEITYTQMNSFSGSLVQVELASLTRFISIDTRRFASRYCVFFLGVRLRR